MSDKYSAVIRVRMSEPQGTIPPLRIVAELDVSGAPIAERLLVERQVEQAHLCSDTYRLTKELARFYGPSAIVTIEVKFHKE